MKIFILVLLLVFSGSGLAQTATNDLSRLDASTAARVRSLGSELRCLVCQNQTIADSDADLAVDLRKQIIKMIAEGKSDREIQGYMVARYGDFVLYKPPVKSLTWLLWFGPFIALFIGLIGWWLLTRQKVTIALSPSPSSAYDEARQLLLDDTRQP